MQPFAAAILMSVLRHGQCLLADGLLFTVLTELSLSIMPPMAAVSGMFL